MSDAAFSSPIPIKRITRLGIWLVGILGLSTFGVGVVLIASVGHLPRPAAIERAGASSLAATPNSVTGSMEIPGFQRRGNTLVGEVVTRDGTSLRLVFDAQSKKLIGLRAISPPAGSSAQR